MNPLLSHAAIGLATLVIGVCIGFSLSERKKFKYQLVQNVSVAIISLLALSGLLVAIAKYEDATTCQAQYNKNLTTALAERSEAADTERAALIQALDSVLDPKGTVESRTAAINTWRSTLKEVDDKRRANPIPITPDCAKDI